MRVKAARQKFWRVFFFATFLFAIEHASTADIFVQ